MSQLHNNIASTTTLSKQLAVAALSALCAAHAHYTPRMRLTSSSFCRSQLEALPPHLLPLLLLLPAPCTQACVGPMLPAGRPSHSSALYDSHHTCMCGRLLTETLRDHTGCCRTGCCRHAGLQSRLAPCQLLAAAAECPCTLPMLVLWRCFVR
jgi:hypothetical protein